MIYLATPYFHANPEIRKNRVKAAEILSAYFAEKKIPVFSPIAYNTNFRHFMTKEFSHEEWMQYDLPFLAASSMLFVAEMSGWAESRGISEEIEFAKQHGKPILHIHYMSIQEILNRHSAAQVFD